MTEYVKYLNMKIKYNHLYFISDQTGKRELHKYNLGDGSIKQVTEEDQNVKKYWFADDQLIISTDFNGNEREQFKLLDENIHLTDSPEYYHYYGTTVDERLIYLRNHQDKAEFELYSSTPGGDRELLQTFGRPIKILSKYDDRRLLISQDTTNINQRLYLYDLDEGEAEELPLPEGRFKSYTSLDDSRAVFISDYTNGYLNLYSLNKKTWHFERITDFEWNIEHFTLSADKNTSYLTLNENGFSRVYKFDINERSLTKLELPFEGVIHSFKKNKSHLYFLYSGMAEPHHFYRYDLIEGSLEKLFGNPPVNTEVSLSADTYISFDDLDVPYYLYEQPDGNVRTVINIHGGPESQARPEFNELYYKLYKEGCQVAVPNIRGSTGYHKFYIGLDDKERRLDAVRDVVYLRNHLIDVHGADEDHIFIMGRSYGGFITLLSITQYPELWKGAVDIVGISHLKTLLKNTSKWRRELRSHEYGFIGEHDKFMKSIAPLENSAAIKAPLRIFHSKHDVRVPCTESEQMFGKMKKQGKDVEFVAYENEGHQFLHTENIDDMNKDIVKFFNELSE